ncbi:MAG: thiamine pyrophosphate-binding protein, partial [Candidatus Omnitrophica bacterium]|nr:thiamine pyrophosphate-binding protein [Candidatus Omnitrophota bacterium]
MNGAQILIESLKHAGAEVVFGYPGGSVLPIFDRLYNTELRFILV